MQCKEFETILEHEGLAPLHPAASEHLAECSVCQDFLADLTTIQSLARELPADANPPERLWISLRAQLTAEGVIRESVELPAGAPWWQSFPVWLRPRTLATAGAGVVLVATAAFLSRSPIPQPVARISNPAVASPVTPRVTSPAGSPVNAPVVSPVKGSSLTPRPSPTEEAMANGGVVLNQAELAVPNMQLAGNATVDASLRDNLRTVNEFIAECQQHLKQHPGDQLAREYLESAYQQKAELLAAMMDSGRSEH
jgi:hypothetical protein